MYMYGVQFNMPRDKWTSDTAGDEGSPSSHATSDATTGEENPDAPKEKFASLVEACKNRDAAMVDMLIRHGARDDDCEALLVAAANHDYHLMSKILALRAFADPEFKINKKAIELPGFMSSGMMGSVTFSSLFPTTPVMINWHSLGCLIHIRKQWLMDAAIAHNIKLKLNLQNQATSLLAITRLDLSNNGLKKVPLCIFQMPSLRIMVLSQNKLESLPEVDSDNGGNGAQTTFGNRMKKSSSFTASISQASAMAWMLPCLEEMHLQDNRIESVPTCLFDLPSLQLLDLSNNKLRCLPYRLWLAPKLRDLNLSLNLLRDLPAKVVPSSYLNLSPRHSVTTDSETASSSKSQSSSSKPVSRDSLNSEEDEERSKNDNLKLQPLRHFNLWSSEINVVSASYLDEHLEKNQPCKLSLLNLSHNGFTSIPKVLACMATSLTRLNLSYNCLTSIGNIKLFPANLKHLDLSFNQLNSWSRVDLDGIDGQCCIATDAILEPSRESGSPILKPKTRTAFCIHKQHTRLDNLRSLVLANNQLCSFNLVNDSFENSDEFEQLPSSCESKQIRAVRLLYPNLSMLDVSNNQIREVPLNISELYNLSVLHLSGNTAIYRLPPEMGLLDKLWNLGLRGCNLNEPLKSMVESKKYKTMDIIGYLKSILENAKPYARMKLMVVGLQGIGKTSLLEQLRQEGTGSYRRRPPEHWGKRMGNKNVNMRTPKGVTLSTVGVDVCDWTYEKKVKGFQSYGPVTFRTWDFGGQKEYYSTHQYFLSKRSLYLVVWKMIDGEKAVNAIQQWLVNIQARAPNAPVIIVGTHYDLIKEFYPPFYSQELQQTIRDKFINLVDADKCGLPRVIDSIEVSAKTHHNIKLLCNLIYDTVFGIKCPGSKERLLEQKIPAAYLALEDVIGHLATERRLQGKDPVLRADDYRTLVMEEMQRKFKLNFRDMAELNQATAFLHDNGVLLHYEDSTLKDLYFLDPQWLCDILAHVVTIREINPYARNGIMQSDDLKHLFKASSCAPVDTKTYIVNLLNKFEVALTWDNRTLLIPSLLPTEQSMISGVSGCDVRIPVRSRGWALRGSRALSTSTVTSDRRSMDSARSSSLNEEPLTAEEMKPHVIAIDRPELAVYRLLLMTYFPSGFWSRLMTRMLGDDFIIEIIRSYFIVPKEAMSSADVISVLNRKAEWICWQSGLILRYMNQTIFRVKEVLPNVQNLPMDYGQSIKFMLKLEDRWNDLELQKASVLEIYLPNQNIQIRTHSDKFDIEPNQECVAKLLALTVDHIDTLLEDWYPSLGTRFVHTSEGKFLVTRLVPCIRCLNKHVMVDAHTPLIRTSETDAFLGPRSEWQLLGAQGPSGELIPDSLVAPNEAPPVARVSHDSSLSRDSDIGYESAVSSRKSSKEGTDKQAKSPEVSQEESLVYCFLVEECILHASEEKSMKCPSHGDLSLRTIAPDTVFVDLGEHYLVKPENVRRGKMLGRGAFGFVFRSVIKQRGSLHAAEVAMKMLQPADPGHGARQSDAVAFKIACNKWERDPMQYACKAYCTARQELNILLTLRHPHIVPLIGVCTKPLALILRLAPMGALDVLIKEYRRSGAQINPFVLQKVLLQVSKALEYLHQQHIIYRDLKSENVLVWKMPQPYECGKDALHAEVDVKIADYGISRSALPTGTKGFGGTEGFMAPEIMRHNGDEEYTEKVDCFSFGMFIFELISLHQPFEGQECVRDSILDGGRPPLSPRNLLCPTYVLDLMSLCWSEAAKDRPAASQIVSIVSAPEFIHMLDCVSLVDNYALLSAAVVERKRKKHFETWLTRLGKQTDILFSNENCWYDYKTLTAVQELTITASCAVPESTMWLGDSRAIIHIYSTDKDYEELSKFRLDPTDDTPTAVRSLVYSKALDSVAISSTSGRIWICERVSHNLREIGNNGIPFLSLTCVDIGDQKGELWSGQTEGRICVITVNERIVSSQEVLNHYENETTPVMDRLDVFELTNEHPNVWTYLYPGCVVYHWDVPSRKIIHKLDCSKLAPCSESLMSISIEEHLLPGKCQVTAMAVMNDELYIGTTWGCLVIVEGSTMRPVTVFRPYEEEIRAILPFESTAFMNEESASVIEENLAQQLSPLSPVASGPRRESTSSNVGAATSTTSSSRSRPKYLVTVGKGFRSLVSRYIYLPKEKRALLSQRGYYVLLWKTGNWIT